MRLLLPCLLVLVACKSEPKAPEVVESPHAVPTDVTLNEFQHLRFLEGSWLGAQDTGAPFFEGYHFLDDSTIAQYTYADSTFKSVSDSSRITWSEKRARSGDAASGWIATQWDSSSVRFESLKNSGRSFTWTVVAPGAWSALLESPGSTVTYQMTKVKGKP